MVDADSFIPMIVINSPVAGGRQAVMGQVDVYPTLLDLMGVADAPEIFTGLGFSAFDSVSPGFAIDLTGHIAGDTTLAGSEIIRHVISAPDISSTLIRADMLSQ